MAVDMFLKIDGIPGESTDASHRDEIDLLSYTWGES
jgi:type VI secretion system secreted protein Hcp